VKWVVDDSAKNLSFYSISSDGRLTLWHLMKNKLEAEEVVKLKLMVDSEKELADNKKEPFVYGLAGGIASISASLTKICSLLVLKRVTFIYVQLFTLVSTLRPTKITILLSMQ